MIYPYFYSVDWFYNNTYLFKIGLPCFDSVVVISDF